MPQFQVAHPSVQELLALPADLDRQPHDRVAVDTCQPLDAADAVAFNEQVNDGLLLSFLRRRSAGTLKPNNNMIV
jgi:hypothetical protein